jgi:hypothetical protein
MLATLLREIEATGFFSQIRESAYAYPGLLWLHFLGLIVWGGAMLMADLRWLGWGRRSEVLAEMTEGLRWPKRIGFAVAAMTGTLLFGAKAGQYVNNPTFWIKMALLGMLGANYLLLRRRTSQSRLQLAASVSLVLWIGAIWAARGPATVKDIMHSMVDPSADFLFESVQIVSDDRGIREIAPQTAEQWKDVGMRATVLMEVPDLLSAPGLRAARPRDRSASPEIENEPAEVQQLMDADFADFVRRAARLRQAASVAKQAVDAKNKDALLLALDGIDKACEVCHLKYWYPKDQRAQEAARAAGIIE